MTAMIVAMLGLFALSVPVAVAIGLAAMVAILVRGDVSMLVLPQQLYVSLDSFPLVAVPFFILSGSLMEAGGLSVRLVDFARVLVGRMQGGLAAACVLTCMIFSAVSGSNVATVYAIGVILIPALVRQGYPVTFAAALQAGAGELGVIIPPSIPMILYGVSAEVSIGELYIAGFGPGFLIAGALIAYVLIWCRFTGHGRADGESRLAFVTATKRAALALMMPVIVLGGIYGGVFTPTEASIVSVFYALIVGMFVYREIKARDLIPILERAVLSATTIMLILATTGVFNFLISRAGLPAAIGAWITATFDGPFTFLLALNLFLFAIGTVLETPASVVVLAPILVPVAAAFGIDPVHLGVIMVINLALGMITPPVGVNMFAACAVAKIPLERIFLPILPFCLVVLACLMLTTYVPQISLLLRDWVYAKGIFG